jgi:hypothetical protein
MGRRCGYGECNTAARWFGPLRLELDDPQGMTCPTYACDAHTDGLAFVRSIEVFDATGSFTDAEIAAAVEGHFGEKNPDAPR